MLIATGGRLRYVAQHLIELKRMINNVAYAAEERRPADVVIQLRRIEDEARAARYEVEAGR